jgi:hypothetical protein
MDKLLKKLGDAIRADKKEYALDILELISDEYGTNKKGVDPIIASTKIIPIATVMPLHSDKTDEKIDEAALLTNRAAAALATVKSSNLE